MTDTRKLFGTDGVRGVANVYPMTAEVALQLGRALAYVIKFGSGRHRIVVGKDTRLSGYLLEYATVAGICSMGVDAVLLGPFPTPGIAFITSSMRADAGVVISASHNPYQDNGIKFFSGNGFKLPDELEARIEVLMTQPEVEGACPTATEVGQAFRLDDARGRYISFLKSTFPKEMELDGLKIVVDCAHGATYRIAPEIFTELGAEVIPMGVRPNGRNINHKCGATSPETMATLVKRHGADLGIAFDGDGDRVIMVDHRGEIVDGDHIMGICAQDMLERGTLRRKTVVGTVMTNLGLELALKDRGIRLLRTPVGDRYVVEAMLKGGYNLGRRAVRPHGLPELHHHRGRHSHGAQAAVRDAQEEQAAGRTGRFPPEMSPDPHQRRGQGEKGSEDLAPGPPGHPGGGKTPRAPGTPAGALLRDGAQTARHDRR